VTVSYWLANQPPLSTPLVADTRCDVAVIGAGLCGASAALALSKAGVDVLLLEADQIAGRATGRNAGFILQGTAERYNRAVTMMGAERARAIHAWTLVNHDRIAETVASEDIDCAYRRAGSLQLAGTDREEHELRESAEMLVRDGFEATLLDSAALGPVYTSAGFNMGVLLPRDGELDPARFVRGVVQAAARHGARVAERTAVTAMDASSPGDVRLETEHGATVRCELVLVCTNARIGALLPWYADKIDPVRGQMLATAPAPRIFEWPIYADHGYDYWRQDEHGRVVLGGWRNLDPSSEVGLADQLHMGIQEKMARFLERFEPLRGVPVTHRWSGIMGFSRDGLPLLGPAPGAGGALAAAGFTGHGFGFAFLAGEALATVALEGQHPFAELLSVRRLRG
jgi:glycine/D-amino acid oxidase-like deaminating enzyme